MRSSIFVGWKNRLIAALILFMGFQVAFAQVNDPPPVPVKPRSEYLDFLSKFPDAHKVDAFYFFKNLPNYKGKLLMLDAKFQQRISESMIFVKMWRNFGTLSVIVTDIPQGNDFPENKSFLLVGLMTDYRNEVVDGKLESMPILKFRGKYDCVDFRCNQ